jgi:hypothetical protein
MPCPAPGLRQIDTAEKQHEFFVAEGDFVSLCARFRPPETSLLHALVAQLRVQVLRSQRCV